ncbi:MAG: polymerase subunit delta [Bacillota bacterium]|jgi:DNA polymerase-3 subunit delta'
MFLLAPVYCFYGPAGSGKYQAALKLAQKVNCASPGDKEACGKCKTCQEIEQGTFPYLYRLDPKQHTIKLDQVRSLLKELAYTPAPNIVRVVIVSQAEKMTPQAANSMLKALEDVREQLLFILLTAYAGRILTTVFSRCERKVFSCKAPVGLTALHRFKGDYSDEELQQKFQAVVDWSRLILAGQQQMFFFKCAEKNEVLVLKLLLFWWRELLYNRLLPSEKKLLLEAYEVECAEQVKLVTSSRLLQLMNLLLDYLVKVEEGSVSRLVIEEWLLLAWEEKAIC